MLKVNINIDEIVVEKLINGKKGRYLDLVVFLRDEKDQYGNDGFVSQSVTKEERERGVKMPILGNAKWLGGGGAAQSATPVKPLEVGKPKPAPKATMPPVNPEPIDPNELPF